MRISCITLNNFSSLPLTRYFIQYFISLGPTELTEYAAPGQYEFAGLKKYTAFARFNNIHEALSQSRTTKIKKYLTVLWQFVRMALRKQVIIYTPDFQVIQYAILFKKILRQKKWNIIYHQFETIEVKRHSEREVRIWNYLITNSQYINLLLFPEKNRMEYFLKEAPEAAARSIVMPNTCETALVAGMDIHEKLKHIPPGATIVGHVGNVGPDHYLDFFFELLTHCKNKDIYFVMVGNYSKQVLDRLEAANNPKMILLSAVPHRELESIYRALHYGLILYRGVDVNFEFCAPNKLYEYWSYGIPVIAHQLQGLTPVFDSALKGKLFDFNKNETIAGAAGFLQSNRTQKKELQQLFAATLDVRTQLQPVINKINPLAS
jgi:glycosyltransferase involved in cell wall biosynthesis